MKANCIFCSLFAFVLFVCGCGQKLPDGMPKLEPCSATFVQDGAPLVGALVDLLPKEGDAQWNISGTTDSNGRIDFMTHGLYKGVPKGHYCVVVSKRENGAKDGRGYTVIYSVVDKKYTAPTTTPLEISVGSGDGKNEFDLGKPVKVQVDKLEPTSNAKG